MRNFDWDDFWSAFINFVIALSIITFTVIAVKAFTADHKIRGYYLSTSTSTNGGNNPKIVIDIDWQPDEYILPERQMSHIEVMQMVDSLNATLKK